MTTEKRKVRGKKDVAEAQSLDSHQHEIEKHSVRNIQVDPPGSISDHGLVNAKFSSKSPTNKTSVPLARCWRNVTDCSSKKLLRVVRCVHPFYLQRQLNYLTNITRR